MSDIHNNTSIAVALNTAAISTNTTTSGNIIDTRDTDGLEFVIQTGVRTDGSYLPLIEEGNIANLSDAAAVPDKDLLGLEADATIAAANTVSKVGYKLINRGKRYVRLSIVSSAVTSGATVGAIVIQKPLNLPST